MKPHDKARAWRLKHQLTPEQLSELIGYSRESIFWMEKGMTPQRPSSSKSAGSREIKPWVWRRYVMACAGAEIELTTGKAFKW